MAFWYLRFRLSRRSCSRSSLDIAGSAAMPVNSFWISAEGASVMTASMESWPSGVVPVATSSSSTSGSAGAGSSTSASRWSAAAFTASRARSICSRLYSASSASSSSTVLFLVDRT